MTNRFCKQERLKGKITFEKLVKGGKSIYQFPLRLIYLVHSENEADKRLGSQSDFNAFLGISVPKRKFKKAVDRNRIKRLIRESYRKLKETELYPFLKGKGIKVDLLLVYTHHEIIESKLFFNKLNLLLTKFKNEFR